MDSQQAPAGEDLPVQNGSEAAVDASGAHPMREPREDSVAPPPSDAPSPSVAVAPSPNVPARVLGFLSENRSSVVDILSLGALAIVVFLLELQMIGIGGDAIRKWHFVRQWFYKNDFGSAKWDHHMARLGVNGVAYLVQVVFGRGPRAYYIAPVSAAVVQVLAIYVCGRRLGGRLAGVFSAVLLITFPPFHHAASQLLPEIFSGAYSIIAMYLLLRYADAEESKRTPWLVAMSVTLFADYLAKETNVFFYPGFVVTVFMVAGRRRFRDVALLLGILAIGVAGETAFYHFFTNYSHRFAVVEEQHPSDAPQLETTFTGLFARFEAADPAWRFAFYAYTATSLGVLGFGGSAGTTAIVLVGWSYYFFLTFLIRGINPVVIWQAFRSRYLDPGAPFVFLTTGLFLSLVAKEVWRRHGAPRWAARESKLLRLGSAAVLGISVLIGYGYYRNAAPNLEENPLVALPKMKALVTDTYRRNLPLVAARDTNGLWAVYATVLDDRLLARQGKLPEFTDLKKHGERKTYIARDPSAYTGEVLARLISTHCYMEAVGKDGHFTIRRPQLLPPQCDAELRDK